MAPSAPAAAVGTVLPVLVAPMLPGLAPVVWLTISSKLTEWKYGSDAPVAPVPTSWRSSSPQMPA